MNCAIQKFLAVWLLAASAVLSAGQSPDLKCVVCREAITNHYSLVESSALAEKQPVCDDCLHLRTTCFICGLPVKVGFRTFDDGRLLCEQDTETAIFTQREAEGVWEEARREVIAMFARSTVLPKRFTVRLVDRAQMAKARQDQFSLHGADAIMGLTRSHRDKQREFDHEIYLLDGLKPARLAAICAHEFTHTWLHENLSEERRLDADTLEAFCELVAYKLMTQRNESVEKKVILANAYTHGQINALVQAEDAYQFHRVLDWFRSGADQRIDKSDIARVLNLQKDTAPILAWYPPAPPTSVPDTLQLKGISGTPSRRFALVNDCTLQKDEQAKVRIGKTNLVVRCLEITDRSVILQPLGSGQKIELTFSR